MFRVEVVILNVTNVCHIEGVQISTSKKKIFRFLAIFLLLFNGVGAVVGGWILMIDPSGTQMQLPLDYLKHIPFKDYFIPGLILFVANGLLSFVVLIATVAKGRFYTQMLIVQGAILSGWIMIQILMVQDVYYLHYLMGSVGLALMGLGFVLSNKDYQSKYQHSK